MIRSSGKKSTRWCVTVFFWQCLLKLTIFIYISQCTSNEDIENFRYLVRHCITAFAVYHHGERQGIEDIPFGPRYYQMTLAEHLSTVPDGIVSADLRPESDFDRRESASWLTGLLYRKYGTVRSINLTNGSVTDDHLQMYSTDPKHYKKLLEAWISWAIRHDISCHTLDDLPGAPSYIRMERLKKRAADAFKIGGGSGGRK